MIGNDIVDLDARAVRGTVGLVARIGPADLARPTPCGEWTLGELLTHMTAQHDGFAAAAAGDGGGPGPLAAAGPDGRQRLTWCASTRRPPSGSSRRSGPTACWTGSSSWRRSAGAAVPGAAQAIGFHLVDYVVHGWDVARSLGLPYQPEPDLLAAALPVAQAVPDGEPRKQAWSRSLPGPGDRGPCWIISSACSAGVPAGRTD